MASIDPTSAGLAGRDDVDVAAFPAGAGVELSGPAGTHGCAVAPERAQAQVNERTASKLFRMAARSITRSLLSCPA